MIKKVFFLPYLILIIGFCNIENTYCQNKTSKTLSEKLMQLEKNFNVNFSFNHTFFDSIILKEDFNCTTIKECLYNIQKSIPVKFTLTNTNNYMVTPERKTISFTIFDNENQEDVSSIFYQINSNKKQPLILENDVFTLKDIFLLDTIRFSSYFHESKNIIAKELYQLKRLQLQKKQFHLNEIVLSSFITQGIDAKISDHSLQINTQTLSLLAGETDGDIFNVLHNIPGIHTPSGKAGNLNFRGNTYDQNLIQIDDIPIYHSGHFLGAISPYNTSIITNVEVQKNMLPAKFGGRVGGLINMTTTNKIEEKTSYEAAINTLFAGATIKAKLLEDKLSFAAAFRTSYPRFKSPKLDAISTLIFQGSRLDAIADQINTSDDFEFGFLDMNAKLVYKINNKHTASVSFIDIQNHLSAKIKDTQNTNQTDFRDLDLDNWGITGKWKANFTDKFSSEVRVSKSKMNLLSISEGFVIEERSSLEKYDNTITDSRFILETKYQLNNNLNLEAGYNITNHQLVSNEIELEQNKDDKRDQKANIHAAYISLQKNLKDKFIINLGLHNNYYAPTKKMYVNPRFSASYTFGNGMYLKSSFGTSNQFIQKKFSNDFDDFNITNQLWYLPNTLIKPLKATQRMLGFVLDNSNWLVDLELYANNTNNITNKSDDTQGNLKSSGANIFIKKRWSTLETWLSYALSNTKTNFNNISTDAFYDQKHLLNLTSLVTLKQWKFALSWACYSGMPIIYPDEQNSNEIVNDSDRFKALHQLDFSTSYTLYNTSKTFKTVIGLSILNAYNQDNIVNIFQNTSENTYRKASKFSPNLQINVYF